MDCLHLFSIATSAIIPRGHAAVLIKTTFALIYLTTTLLFYSFLHKNFISKLGFFQVTVCLDTQLHVGAERKETCIKLLTSEKMFMVKP